ncbi:MAG: anthranilate synthase component I family protein [Sphingobacteriales bacterium]|nr:anthranilate synthase component I family protein [Sphingobacteriales bacterium]
MQIHDSQIFNFKEKAIHWANQFDICCILDSNQYTDPYSKFDFIVAAGTKATLSQNETLHAFEELKKFRLQYQGWIFGGLAYDLKNEIEPLTSQHQDGIQFPDLFFFAPQFLLILKGGHLEIIGAEEEFIWKQINQVNPRKESFHFEKPVIKSRFSKTEYLKTVHQIKEEIALGNIYETNFCMEFYAEDAEIHPLDTYLKLNQLSPTPFSNYFKWFDKYILSATPERFLSKRGQKLISQPIKGTAKRSGNLDEDEQIKRELVNHPKEKQENVMIVDLVRNDLTKSAKKGSVKVEELFGVYSFKQVHQMISTVVCELNEDIHPIDAIKNTFPMGSMTGAPKIKAMQLMEHYERTKRGIYSGAVGYFSPDDDFDFNVIIRTILYHSTKKYLSFQVGSAITFYADAEKEYEECLLKVKAILEVLS